jgi:hypothetical protein
MGTRGSSKGRPRIPKPFGTGSANFRELKNKKIHFGVRVSINRQPVAGFGQKEIESAAVEPRNQQKPSAMPKSSLFPARLLSAKQISYGAVE